jgi:hypothetical protein
MEWDEYRWREWFEEWKKSPITPSCVEQLRASVDGQREIERLKPFSGKIPDCLFKRLLIIPGVWISFSKHSPNWRVVPSYYSPSQETTGPKYRKDQWDWVRVERKKNSPGWPVALYFYSPSLNSTRIWRVGEWLSAPLGYTHTSLRWARMKIASLFRSETPSHNFTHNTLRWVRMNRLHRKIWRCLPLLFFILSAAKSQLIQIIWMVGREGCAVQCPQVTRRTRQDKTVWPELTLVH